MKIAEWIMLNREILRIDDVIVKVFRKESYKTEDMVMETKIRLYDMAQMFAEYTIFFINFGTYTMPLTNAERTTLCFGIYLKEASK